MSGKEEDGPTAGEIWTKLKSIDVNEHTEKKGNLTYLSWAWAYSVMMDNFPEFNYVVFPVHTHEDGSATVSVEGSIGHTKRMMWLPVMDNRNNSIIQPTSREISDAVMRCLVKCIAMFGLGVYIYAGEDVPDDGDDSRRPESASKAKKEVSAEAREGYEATATAAFAFIEDVEDSDSLRDYWKENSETFKRLKNNVPDIYENVLKEFKAKTASFK